MNVSPEDQQRLEALKRFFVLDHAPSEDELERIVRFTGQFFGVTYAFLTLRHDDGEEKVAAAYGFDAHTLPDGACLFQREDGPSIPVAVADASVDSRFEKNPLIHAENAARLYASVPLKSAQGFTLGTLALMDTSEQELNSAGMAMLANIGALVEPVLQLVQARKELEVSTSSLAQCHTLSDAGVAANNALSAGPSSFSEALGHIGPAAACRRAALFNLASATDGRLVATCEAVWHAEGAEPITPVGQVLDFDSEGFGSWPAAFAAQQAVSEQATGPLLSTNNAQFVAAIPLSVDNTRPGFVLLDRPSPWSEAELSTLQLAFAPLAAAMGSANKNSEADVVESSPHPIAIVGGAESRILLTNGAANDILGLGADGGVGRTFMDVGSESDRERLASFLTQALQTQPEPADIRLYDGSGGERLVRISASPISFEGNAAALLMWVDISADRRREVALADERDNAKEAARNKSAFLANMSHEIRTALTSILGYAEFLADELDADQLDMAKTILSTSERLFQTLNSVMDMERLESEGDSPSVEPVSVGALIQDAVRLYERQAIGRDLAFICEGAERPIFAWADEGALNRVLANLVSNALKFTTEGGIRLRVSSENDWVYLEVQDTGTGIDEEFLPHLFDEFKREDSENSGMAPGSGLGLALCTRLVDLMGGQISVTSRKGQGSIFRVALRAAPVPVSSPVGGDGVAIQQAQATA